MIPVLSSFLLFSHFSPNQGKSLFYVFFVSFRCFRPFAHPSLQRPSAVCLCAPLPLRLVSLRGQWGVFLDPTYKWERVVFVLLCRTYFEEHKALQVHPRHHTWQYFILFYGPVIFQGVNTCL